jgi:hypothetical protein
VKFEKRDYQDSEALQTLALKIVNVVPELEEARSSAFKAFYSSVEPEHIGGKCRKLDGAVRFQTGSDFFLLVHKESFADSDELHKIRLLCHELYHIARDRNSYAVRRHAGYFCEIAEHDRFSYRLALKAMAALGLKYDRADVIAKYTGLAQD